MEGMWITDDIEADKALLTVKEKREEIDRLTVIAKREIEEIQTCLENHKAQADQEISQLLKALEFYFDILPNRHCTKTQASYNLLHGKLVRKRGTVKYQQNDTEALANWLRDSGYDGYTETKVVPKWGEFKKLGLTADPETGVVTVAATGEVVQGVTAVQGEDSFDVR